MKIENIKELWSIGRKSFFYMLATVAGFSILLINILFVFSDFRYKTGLVESLISEKTEIAVEKSNLIETLSESEEFISQINVSHVDDQINELENGNVRLEELYKQAEYLEKNYKLPENPDEFGRLMQSSLNNTSLQKKILMFNNTEFSRLGIEKPYDLTPPYKTVYRKVCSEKSRILSCGQNQNRGIVVQRTLLIHQQIFHLLNTTLSTIKNNEHEIERLRESIAERLQLRENYENIILKNETLIEKLEARLEKNRRYLDEQVKNQSSLQEEIKKSLKANVNLSGFSISTAALLPVSSFILTGMYLWIFIYLLRGYNLLKEHKEHTDFTWFLFFREKIIHLIATAAIAIPLLYCLALPLISYYYFSPTIALLDFPQEIQYPLTSKFGYLLQISGVFVMTIATILIYGITSRIHRHTLINIIQKSKS